MTGKKRGRPSGRQADGFVVGENATTHAFSWKDIPVTAVSSGSEEEQGRAETGGSESVNAETRNTAGGEEPSRGHNNSTGAAAEEGSTFEVPAWEENDHSGPAFSEASNAESDSYLHQLLSICPDCLPPIVPAVANDQREVNFCMPSFNAEKGCLSFSKFAMPGLCRVALVAGEVDVAYWCTCTAEMELQKSIFSGISRSNLTTEYLSAQAEPCIHLKVLLRLAAAVQLDIAALCKRASNQAAQDGAGTGEDEEETGKVLNFGGPSPRCVLLGHAGVDCVVVVESKVGAWTCTHCYGKGKDKCWHVQKVAGGDVPVAAAQMTAAMFEEKFTKGFDVEAGRRRLLCRSRLLIPEPHQADAALMELLDRRSKGEVQFPTLCSADVQENCLSASCGAVGSSSSSSLREATIFHLLGPVQTTVEVRTCICGHKWHYDGRADGILNASDSYLFSYETLNWYSNQMWRTRYPFHTMWRALLATFAQQGVPPIVLQKYVNLRSTFQGAWLDYITLQPIDFQDSFRCVCAGQQDWEPSDVIGDGIMLGYRSDLARLVPPHEFAPNQPYKTGSIHQKRIFVADEHTRSLLLKFCKKSDKASGGLSATDLQEVQRRLDQETTKAALFLLEDSLTSGGKHYCEEGVSEMLFALATNAPVCVLLPLEVEETIEQLLEVRTFQSLAQEKAVATRAPVLWDFLKAQLSRGHGVLPLSCSLLLQRLIVVARQAYVEEPLEEVQRMRKRKLRREGVPRDSEIGPRERLEWSEDESFLRTGHFFPNQPICRPLRKYAADHFSQKVGPTCTKYKTNHKKLTPDLYPFFCLNCAMCVGFVVLADAESPRVVFEVLYSRWRRPPKRFIYDNVCHEHTYSLNREPAWAAKIQWLIDWLHTLNHKDCSPAYGIGRYPTLHNKNSQLNEQKNSRLTNIKSQSAYMGQMTFLYYARFFLYCLNKQQKLGDLAC